MFFKANILILPLQIEFFEVSIFYNKSWSNSYLCSSKFSIHSLCTSKCDDLHDKSLDELALHLGPLFEEFHISKSPYLKPPIIRKKTQFPWNSK